MEEDEHILDYVEDWDIRKKEYDRKRLEILRHRVEPKKYTWDESHWNHIFEILKEVEITKKDTPKKTKKKRSPPRNKKSYTREEVLSKCIDMIGIFLDQGEDILKKSPYSSVELEDFLRYLRRYRDNMKK